MLERNIRLEVEYRGTAYSGWQAQKSDITIQGELTRAIHRVTGREVNLIGAGRTDAGVEPMPASTLSARWPTFASNTGSSRSAMPTP
jgi:tRNA pseudouridine38-40 synthase